LFSFIEPALRQKHNSHVVERQRDIRMIGAERFFFVVQSPPIKRLGKHRIAALKMDGSQIV